LAVRFSRIGTPVDGTTSLVLPYLDHIAAGEQLAIFISHKNSAATVDVPAGWTQEATITGGTGSGVDAGTVRGTVLRRTADGTETGNLTITFTGLSGTTGMGGVMASITGSVGGTWVFPGSVTVASSLAGSVLQATAANPGVVAGDLIVAFAALNTDGATFTAEAFSCAGVTFDTLNERFDAGTPKGEDEGLLICDAPVLAGPSSGTITFTATASLVGADAPKGGVIFFVLRETVPTAIITKSGHNHVVAGITRVTLSAQDSYQSVASPADCAMTAAPPLWDFGDGTTEIGFCVNHRWDTSGTKTVTLTMAFANGAITSTSTTVTVEAAPTFLAFTKYVDNTRPDDTGSGNSPATAYKTIAKAIDVWTTFRGASSTGFAPGRILCRGGGQSHSTAGTNGVDFGPLLLDTYSVSGESNLATLSIAAGSSFALGFTSHDNLYDNWVVSRNISPVFAAEDVGNTVGMTHVATQLEDASVTRGEVILTGSGSSLLRAAQTLGYSKGVFPSAAYLVIRDSSFTANGHDGALHHQLYASAGTNHSAFLNVTCDANGASAALDAFKTSGCNKLYLKNCTARAAKTAFDVGGNLGEETKDVVYDGCTSDACLHQGAWHNLCSRISIRNTRSFGNLDAALLEVQPISTGVNGIQALNSSFSQFTGIFFRSSNSNFTAAVVKNCAAYKANSGVFYDIANLSDLSKIAADHNVYYRTGGASTGFAVVGGVTKTFAEWQGLGMDVNSRFADPLFTNPANDLSISKFSPCVDTGITTRITTADFLGTSRPQGGDYDIGAYEYIVVAGLPAFPGAEGYGSDTIGGRGGVVIEVTNLNESGIGSLRWAVEYNGPRTVVFRVAGTITHTLATGALKIENPFITIAGQTAPGEGITLKGEELRVQTHDVIIRYLRVRTGDKDTPHDNYDNRDCINFGQPSDLTGTCQTYNIILDHCSMSWAVDETFTVWYGAHHITLQYCLLSEPLCYSLHPKTLLNGTPHSMSILLGSSSAGFPSYCISIHHNVVISSNQRNPQFSYCDRVDFRNNYYYNWGSKTGSTLTAGAPMEVESPGRKRLNIVANYYAEGPNSRVPAHPTWIRVGSDVATLVDPGAEIYIAGNYGPADGVMVTDPAYNNWLFLRSDGNVQIPETYGAHQYRLFAPFDCPPVTTMAAADVPSILSEVGANRPYRDEIDARVIATVVNDTGLIIDSTDQVGGWLTMVSGVPFDDTDHDGMPDYWEVAHGLNPNDPADAQIVTLSGYTNLELFLNSNEPPPGTSVTITSATMAAGAAMSPVIIPCPPGSGQISPFMRGLVYGHSTHDLPAANFERWADVAANFACWGNGEPKSYVDEEGFTVGAHQGRVSTTKTGTTTAELTNWLFTEWFARFIPKQIAFNNLLADDAHESKPLTNGTGEERRYYYSPAVRRAVYHPLASERQVGWDAAQTINKETIERRPFFHNSKNGNQGGPLPFTAKKGGPPEEINHNELDEFGAARSWNAVGNKALYLGDQWNAWDKQHNCGPAFHMAASIGSRAAMVNLWNNWRWVITSFFPGSDGDSRGKQFDVPRSVGFGAFLAVYAYMAGFEWADPTMIKYHCGGNSNGDGTGQNGNAGWKPSNYFEWIVKSALGTATADNGRVQLMPKGFIYWNIGCDNLGEPSCLCDCANAPIFGPGKSGCNGAAWIGPDGVDYGSQTIGIDLWHAGIECSGLMLIDSLNDYVIKTWGPTRSLLTPTTAASLKSLLSYASLEAIFRCIDPGTFATSHYYTGTAHSQSESPTTPRGYDQSVAQAMLDDMFSCHPEKAVDCAVRPINDGSGKYIVAEKVRNKVDLFYSLSLPWLMYVLGPNNPIVKKWLSAATFIPLPGSEGPNQATNYENHARFTDFAWAMNELGTTVVIAASTMAAGARIDGQQGHPVLITASTMAAGAALDGSFKKGVTIFNVIVRAGASISGTAGKGVVFSGNGVMAAAAGIDGTVEQAVRITASTMAAGASVISTPSAGGGPVVIQGPNRMRAGTEIRFSGLRIGNAVVIAPATLSAGTALGADTYVFWTESTMEAGAALDGNGDASTSFTLLNPVLQAGAAVKGGRPVIKYKNSYTASGAAIIVEG